MYNDIMKKMNFNMEDIKLFDSFAGIGAMYQSLKELGVPTKLVGISEVDIDAIISYASIHINNFKTVPFDYPSDEEMRKWLIDRNIGFDFSTNKSKILRLQKNKLKLCYKASVLTNNYGDISIIDTNQLPDFDLFNISSPCQDFSVAGKQKGSLWQCQDCASMWNPIDIHHSQRHQCPNCHGNNIVKTRSSLIVESLRIVKNKKSKYVIIENVKGMISKKFKSNFDKIIDELNEYGYNCYYPTKEDNNIPTCLNAKDYGIPQNRERIFIVGIRKDVDTNDFKFLKGKDYGIRLQDILEDVVNEKYYINKEKCEQLIKNLNGNIDLNKQVVSTCHEKNDLSFATRDRVYNSQNLSPTLSATMYKDAPKVCMPCITPDRIEKRQNGRRFKEDGEPMFTLTGQDRHGVLQGRNVCLSQLDDCRRIGGLFDIEKSRHQAGSIWDKRGLAPTLDTMQGGYRQPCIIKYEIPIPVKVRKYVVDIEGLKNELREKKANSKYTINEIAIMLDCPTSLAEHWFRNDDCFAIPDADKWFKLKSILGISTTKYDDSIMTFIEKEGVYEKANRIYDDKGISPTITTSSNEKIIQTKNGYIDCLKIRKLTPKECWRLMGFRDEHFDKAQELGISDSQLYKQAGNSIVVNVLYFIFAQLFKKYIKNN